ncbi:MAG: ribosome biosis GTPase Der [Pseudomonadota bacterium]
MRKPLVAVVGRPNVGKSTLFNRLTGSRKAIVEDIPGVTRDRHYGEFELIDRQVRLVDTGGFVPGEDDLMLAAIRDSAARGIAEADAVLWLTNVRDDVTGADEEVGALLRRTDKPVIVLVNKCDSDRLDTDAMAHYSLGFEYLFPISAEHGRGLGDAMDALYAQLIDRGAFEGEDETAEEVELTDEERLALKQQRGGLVERVRISVIGRPNVGKSTLINALLGEDRMLATEVAGTTRDAIDVELEWQGTRYTLVDTAGMRRRSRVVEKVEAHSVGRTVGAIERCHVAILVLDASEPLADQDARIASLVDRRNRACCIVVNKWDAIEKDTHTMRAYEKDLAERLPFLAHAPRIFISAKTGKRVEQVMETALAAFQAFNRIIATSALNRWLEHVQRIKQPPVYKNKRLKLYFAAQTATRPPRIEIQVNAPTVMPSYERFLLNQFRDYFDLGGTPLRLSFVRRRERRATDADVGERPQMVQVIDLYENPLADDELPETWLEDDALDDAWEGGWPSAEHDDDEEDDEDWGGDPDDWDE